MQLYIFVNGLTTHVSGIDLMNGHIPSIGDRAHSSAHNLFVEPSVWFKVLVVDAVSVDCCRRALSWEISSLEDGRQDDNRKDDLDEERRISSMPISRFEADSLDLDEVFDSLPSIVLNYQDNNITKAQFHDELMKLLHMFILPTICLSSSHIDRLRSGLQKQEASLQKIDDDIERASKKFEAVTQSKTRLRQKFIAEVITDATLHSSSSIKSSLVQDIDGDIRDISSSLDTAQGDVDRTKERLSIVNGTTTADQLVMARRVRDEVVRSYETLLTARETLRATTPGGSVSRRRRGPVIPEHKIYGELTALQEEIILKMKTLTTKKLLATSVREAMRLTLNELETGETESYGTDVDGAWTVTATDNVDNAKPATRSWLTLTEQVKKILGESSHPATRTHKRFCAGVIDRCRAAVNERMLFETTFGKPSAEVTQLEESTDSSDASGLLKSGSSFEGHSTDDEYSVDVPRNGSSRPNHLPFRSPSDSPKRQRVGFFGASKPKSGTRNASAVARRERVTGEDSNVRLRMVNSTSDDAVLIFEEHKDYAKEAIASLQRDIASHFETVSELLRSELKLKSKTTAWLSYEILFYDETMEDIITLYSLEYNQVTKMLTQTIRSLLVTDLRFEDSILVNILEDEPTTLTPTERCSILLKSSPNQYLEPQGLHELNESCEDQETLENAPNHCESPDTVPDENTHPAIDPAILRLRGQLRIASLNDDAGFGSSETPSGQHHHGILDSLSTTVRKSMKISGPHTTVILYDRTVCPSMTQNQSATNSISSHTQLVRKLSDIVLFKKDAKVAQSPRARSMRIKREFQHVFRRAIDCISAAMEARCLSTKFQYLAKCLREISRQVPVLCQQLKGSSGGQAAVCSDELMDGLTMLLCNLDGSLLSQLYVQVRLLIDLMPPFFLGSSFDFTLVQFFGAFQVINDRIVLKQTQAASNAATKS